MDEEYYDSLEDEEEHDYTPKVYVQNKNDLKEPPNRNAITKEMVETAPFFLGEASKESLPITSNKPKNTNAKKKNFVKSPQPNNLKPRNNLIIKSKTVTNKSSSPINKILSHHFNGKIETKIMSEDEISDDDLSNVLPLYCGEISKGSLSNLINNSIHKKAEGCSRNKKLFIDQRKRKSYLDMYYAKLNEKMGKNAAHTDTTRAVCDSPSPNCIEVESQSEYSSDSDSSFYKKFLAMELSKNNVKATQKSIPRFYSPAIRINNHTISPNPTKREIRPMKPTRILSGKALKMDKKARQNYGQKVSMKNRIKMVEQGKIIQMKSIVKQY